MLSVLQVERKKRGKECAKEELVAGIFVKLHDLLCEDQSREVVQH